MTFALRMALRESRRSRRRLALYLSSISLGVAALVAINSFSANVSAAVGAQARELLGADLELRSRAPFPDSVEAVLDSSVARVTSFASMVLAPRGGLTRLVEVRAVSGDFPFYGIIETNPPNLWTTFQGARGVLVDPALLVHLDARVGDTVHIGDSRFPILGIVTNAPGDVGLRTAIGPRVFMPAQYLGATNLLRFGSRAQYRAYLEIPEQAALQQFLNRHNALFERYRIRTETAAEEEQDISEALGRLASYLGLVGLVALLLGGLGVGSAVNVFVREKLDGAALLRCLGAPARTVLAIYVIQAVALGTLGAAVGVVLGLGVQMILPAIVGDFIPVRVSIAIDWPTVFAGLAIGSATAAAFALLPLLRLKDVPPLRALRRDTADGRMGGWADGRMLVIALLLAGLVAISIWQAPSAGIGLAFAGAVLATAAVLAAAGRLLMAASRRLLPRRASYVIRQGVANLFRPENQTVPVTLAIGFGVFLVATLYVVQKNLVDQFALDASPDRPNLVLFDIQVDQKDGVGEVLRRHGAAGGGEAPIVPARIARVNGVPAESLVSRWAVRREYRNTYRDTLVESEQLLDGHWWNGPGAWGLGDAPQAPGPRPSPRPRISIEEEVAGELGVAVGDRITWNVQGVQMETEIASVRRVSWARFQPNFFVVFEPGVLERAPQTFVMITRVDDAERRAVVQRDVVLAYPNVSALDLTLVQRALDGLLRSVSLAVRFMALFSIGAGLVILIGALAASRFQRLREAVLLKTMGATGGQVRRIMLTEYVAWGSLAAFVGVLLAAVAGWALTTQLFDSTYRLPLLELAGVWMVVCALTAIVGLANSGEALRGTPLGVLRELSE